MKKKSKDAAKPYWEMTTAELAEATKEFDGPVDISKFRPLTRKERALFERWQRGPSRSIFISRSRRGKGSACQMVVDIDPDLASHCAAFASARHITLAQLVTKSLKKATTYAGSREG